MNSFLVNSLRLSRPNIIFRPFSSTPVLETKQHRLERGLSAHKNSEGILTDGPDYTYLDGRPTPLLHKQKLRMLKQQEYATRIVDLCSELDFAKERHQNLMKEKESERQKIISNRLKPKGRELKKN